MKGENKNLGRRELPLQIMQNVLSFNQIGFKFPIS